MNYGIVAEFNPFHNGHRYIVDKLKDNGKNTVTAVMSGSFVQRGECACVSSPERVEMALKNGVDLVISLPVQYSTASAERFAGAGVDILSSLGVIDAIGFGSECGDSSLIRRCAVALSDRAVDECINRLLETGVSYPVARENALLQLCSEEISRIVAQPNDILGVEYTKAVLRNGDKLCINAIKRIGASHDSSEKSGDICSASAIREMLLCDECHSFMPQTTADILKAALHSGKAPAQMKNAERAILYKLRTMSLEDFAMLPDVSEGLEHRIYSAVRESSSLGESLEKIKTKRYTLSRIRRIILCAFLGITRADVLAPVPYIRVLGFNSKGAELLRKAKGIAALPIVTKSSQIKALDESAQRCFELECTARDVFSLMLPVPDVCGKEMTDKIIIL
ncbi:MAG: nucleotidyltransferase family protein [Clostridia bacterium]|nr:nucleotidyltransferase family protein [Clostridia bacterium]